MPLLFLLYFRFLFGRQMCPCYGIAQQRRRKRDRKKGQWELFFVETCKFGLLAFPQPLPLGPARFHLPQLGPRRLRQSPETSDSLNLTILSIVFIFFVDVFDLSASTNPCPSPWSGSSRPSTSSEPLGPS